MGSFHKQTEDGFSLIEITVIVVIVTILAVMTITNNRQGEKDLAVQRGAHQIGQDVRRAQNMAISGRECTGCGSNEVFGYGIYFNMATTTSYFIYADIYPVASKGNDFYDVQDQKIETFYLKEGVSIQNLNGGAARLCINFRPPDPEVKIKENESDDLASAQINIFVGSDVSKTRAIKINKAGLIDID